MPKILSKQDAVNAKAVYLDGTPVTALPPPPAEPEPVAEPQQEPATEPNESELAQVLGQLRDVLAKFKTPTIRVEPTPVQTQDYTGLLLQIAQSLNVLLSREDKSPVINVRATLPKPPETPMSEWVFEIARDRDGKMKTITATPNSVYQNFLN